VDDREAEAPAHLGNNELLGVKEEVGINEASRLKKLPAEN
jgi:hypothetical protein